MDRKLTSLLSLCMKAGKMATGEVACEKSLQNGTASLIVIAEDASDNTRKKFVNKAFYYKVPALVFGRRLELSRCVGKENRAVYAVTDSNFGGKIKELIEVKA